jgi:hypothetical protein
MLLEAEKSQEQAWLVLGQRSILVLGGGSAWCLDHAQYRTVGEVAHVLRLFNCSAIIYGIWDEFWSMKQFIKVSKAIFKILFKLDIRHFIGIAMHRRTLHFVAQILSVISLVDVILVSFADLFNSWHILMKMDYCTSGTMTSVRFRTHITYPFKSQR